MKRGLPVFVCLAAFTLAGLTARTHWAPTYDEGFHLVRGLNLLDTGTARLSYNHPPLQNLLSAWPVWLHGTGDVRGTLEQSRTDNVFSTATNYAYTRGPAFRTDVRMARWGSVLIGLVLVGGLAAWATTRWGPAAGWLALPGAALLPSLVFHANLATTDVGLTAGAVLGTLCTFSYLTRGGPHRLAVAGLWFVFAALCKFSGLIWLGAFLAVVLPLSALRTRHVRLLWIAPGLLAVFYLACVLFYGTETLPDFIAARAPGWTRTFPGGGYFAGMLSHREYVTGGQRAFVAGRLVEQGAFWHLPLAWLCKTPPLWALTGIAGLALGLLRPTRTTFLACVPAFAFAIGLLGFNKLTLGTRHVLPLGVLMVPAALHAWNACSLRPKQVLGLALALQSGLSLLSAYPSFGSYFAFWAGGLESGHHWFVDSDYDWGQDLEALEKKWSGIHSTAPQLVYFGFSDPRAVYGMTTGDGSVHGFMEFDRVRRTRELASWREAATRPPGSSRVISISALRLQPYGVSLPDLAPKNAVMRPAPAFFLFEEDYRTP